MTVAAHFDVIKILWSVDLFINWMRDIYEIRCSLLFCWKQREDSQFSRPYNGLLLLVSFLVNKNCHILFNPFIFLMCRKQKGKTLLDCLGDRHPSYNQPTKCDSEVQLYYSYFGFTGFNLTTLCERFKQFQRNGLTNCHTKNIQKLLFFSFSDLCNSLLISWVKRLLYYCRSRW